MEFIFKAKVEANEKGRYVKSPELKFHHAVFIGGNMAFKASVFKLKRSGAEMLKKGTLIYIDELTPNIEVLGDGYFVEIRFTLI